MLIREGTIYGRQEPNFAAKCHQTIYDAHPEISAIANAYPVDVSAFSVVNASLETESFPESYVVLRDIQTAPFNLPYEQPEAMAKVISPFNPIAIVANDGALIIGSGLLDVFDRLEVLESTAEMLIDSQALGTVKPIAHEVLNEMRIAFPEAYSAVSAD